MKDLCTHGRSVWCPDCERERHASSKREAKLSPYSKEAVLKREAQARANSNVLAEDRCVNTIHSNYVTDHRCQLRSGHEGDCLFGRAIPNRVCDRCGDSIAPEGVCMRCLHATRNRVTADVASETARWSEIREVAAEMIRQGTNDPAEVIENAMKDAVDIAAHIIKGTLPDGW